MFAGSRLLLPVLTNCVTLTFMNVDGAFILAETHRKSSVLLFVDNSMQIFLRYISLRIWEDVCHAYHIVKHQKNKKKSSCRVSVSAQNFLALWTLNPGAASLCSAVWMTYMQFVRALENITFCSLFTNRLRPFRYFNHHSSQQQPPLPLLIGHMRSSAAVSRCQCLMLVMMSASLSLWRF